MSGNTFGKLFTVTNFGESHGPAIGCVIDGCPPGLDLCEADIQHDLDRRRPGTSKFVTQRNEPDQVQILSGVYQGKTTGTPIALLIQNTDQRSKDYGNILQSFRPGHADYAYWHKYGIRDPRGGGRSSARLTAPTVAAGAVVIAAGAWTPLVAGPALPADAIAPVRGQMVLLRTEPASVAQRGSTHGDSLTPEGFLGNNAGGILGGISTGQDIEVSLAIKPTSSILIPRATIDVEGQPTELITKGRHDPCVGIRATPIAEALLALVLIDHALRHRAQCGDVRVSTPDIAAAR